MHRGYIKIWRKLQDSFVWQNSKALILFIHLLMEANYKETEFIMNYKKIILKRGQLICGRKKLSLETGISEGTIYKLMDMFEHERLIEQQKTNLYTIVTMINYNKYQDLEQQNIQQDVQQSRQQGIQPRNTSKELISIKNKLNISASANTAKAHDLFLRRFKESVGRDYLTTSFGKDRKLLKTIVQSMNKNEYIECLDNFFQDSWAKSNGFTFGIFVSQINKWRSSGARAPVPAL